MATLRAPTAPVAAARRGIVPLLGAAAIGAAVSLGLGVYAKVHDPTNEQIAHFGFPTVLSMKAAVAGNPTSVNAPPELRQTSK